MHNNKFFTSNGKYIIYYNFIYLRMLFFCLLHFKIEIRIIIIEVVNNFLMNYIKTRIY